MTHLADFHFLRPLWLLLIPVAPLLYWYVARRENVSIRWGQLIAPHLLEHLVVGAARRLQFRPIHLICLILLIGGVALSGPTWEREVPPFTEDKAPMVIVLDLSRSMDAIDIQPTRLERTKQKIRDLLNQRAGARNALFVYAGTSHMVLPFTEDPAIVELFLSSLSTSLMPKDGNDASAALRAAQVLLAGDEVPGTILFVTDGIERRDFPAFRAHRDTSRDQIVVLGVGTARGGPVSIGNDRFLTDGNGRRVIEKLDVAGLTAMRDEVDVPVATVTLDETDVKWVQRQAQNHLQIVQQEEAQTRWRDFGYYLVFPIAVLTALWFRRGWTIRWASLFFLSLLIEANDVSAHPLALRGLNQEANQTATGEEPIEAEIDSSGFDLWESFLNLWLTADQQGRYYFEKKEYTTAAKRFEDPFWKGMSYYYNEDYAAALPQFALIFAADGFFYTGNCYARLVKYEEAVASYDEALAIQDDFPEAKENRTLISALIKKKEEEEDEESQQGDPNMDPDEIKFDEKGKKGKKGEIPELMLTPEKMADIWMRNIRTTPADFLRLKFRQQSRVILEHVDEK